MRIALWPLENSANQKICSIKRWKKIEWHDYLRVSDETITMEPNIPQIQSHISVEAKTVNRRPPDWIVSSEWVNSRKILLCIMWYVCFLVCIILMFMEECICLVSLLLKIRLTPRPQSLLPGIILFYYDITMECHSYSYSSRTRRLDGNGVKQSFHCLPDAPLRIYWDWNRWSGWVAKIRRAQEMFVRLKPVEPPKKALWSMNVRTSQNSGK